MIPQPGHIVIIFFRNGVQLEGEVISWSNEQSILKSLTGTSTIVIQKTLDDILFYKFSNAKNEYEKLKEKPHKQEDDIKALAQLKIELNDVERAEIKERLTNHTVGEMKQVNYGIPNIGKIESPKQYTREKGTRENSDIGTGLQNVFVKKH